MIIFFVFFQSTGFVPAYRVCSWRITWWNVKNTVNCLKSCANFWVSRLKTLVLHWSDVENLNLSYQHGWVKALKISTDFACEFFNVKSLNIYRIDDCLRKVKQSDFVVILHSVFSNARKLSISYQILLRLSGKPIVFFVGNEYKHMSDKINFCKI